MCMPCMPAYLMHTGYLSITFHVISIYFWLLIFLKIFLTLIILKWFLQKFGFPTLHLPHVDYPSLVLVARLALVFLAGVSVLSSKGCALQAPLLMAGCSDEGSLTAQQLPCWRSGSKLSPTVWVMRLFLECHESSSWEQ